MSLSKCLLLATVAGLASTAEAVVITGQLRAPVESCRVDPDYTAPAALLDCLDPGCVFRCAQPTWHCTEPCNYPGCGRLVPGLRGAAQTRDATEILVRAGFEYYALRRPELRGTYTASPLVAQALADLAVTGQAAYASFRRLAPTEDLLVPLLRARLLSVFPSHVQMPGDVSGAVQQVLQRSYQVAWALRGPTPYRIAQRDRLGWIAVEAEDDPPHRPVNVLSAPFPQFNMTVRVDATDVVTRYMIASLHLTDDYPVAIDTIPPDREHTLVIGDVILFIHGHSSSVEEALTLAGPLLAQAEARGRPLTVISMDLPSNGYASMIEHTTIAPSSASAWNSGYPILDFYEKFVIAFVEGLEARQPGIKGQIVGVVGGSLGGNMGLRLARRDPAEYPWLRNVVSWSPASAWDSFGRATAAPHEAQQSKDRAAEHPETMRLYYDLKKFLGVFGTRERMNAAEGRDSLNEFFYGFQGRDSQSEHWHSPSWPCREASRMSSHRGLYEIYNARFRRWHWRVAHEQLIYSHWDSDNPSVEPDPRNYAAAGPARYTQIRARMLVAAGLDDDNEPEVLYSNTKALAEAMTMVDGAAFFLEDTGHSIDIEKPAFFAGKILDFLFESPPPPFPAFLVPATSF